MLELTGAGQVPTADLLRARAELDLLLALGQAPPVEAILRRDFLRVCLAASDPFWESTAFPVALAFAKDVVGTPFDGMAPEEVTSFVEVLTAASLRRAPPGRKDDPAWKETVGTAIEWLRQEQARILEVLGGRPRPEQGKAGEADPGLTAGEPGAINIVVILRLHRIAGHESYFRDVQVARVVPLHVQAYFKFHRGDSCELHVDGQKSQSLEGFRDALVNLEALRSPGAPPPGAILIRATWSGESGMLEGRSAAAAFQLASAAARSGLSPGVVRRGFAPNMAIIGDVDGTRVVNVAEDTLPIKVEACFYTSVRRLWVPRGQLSVALRVLARLQERHPERRLEILPADDTVHLWNDPSALVVIPRRPREVVSTALGWFARSRYMVMAALVVLTVVTWFAVQGIRRWEGPVTYAGWVDGTTLNGYNEHQNPVVRIRLPHAPVRVEQPQHRGKRLDVVDLGGPKGDEILALFSSEVTKIDRMAAFDQEGNRLWLRASTFLPQPTRFTVSDVQWYCFAALDVDHDEAAEIVAMRKSPQEGLALIALISGATGRTMMELANPGHFETMAVEDVLGDADPEIILGGTDNRAGRAALVVLDPRRMLAAAADYDSTRLHWMNDPEALDQGVVAALRFRKDKYSNLVRQAVLDTHHLEGSVLRVDVETTTDSAAIQYLLDLEKHPSSAVLRLQPTDKYWGAIEDRFPGTAPTEVDQELDRLRDDTEFLTPSGWQRLADFQESSETAGDMSLGDRQNGSQPEN